MDDKRKDIILNNAFIALYHDEILDVHQENYEHYIDKDTRIIDATGMVAIPGIIDAICKLQPLRKPYISIKEYEGYYKKYEDALHRDMQSLLYEMLKNGITTIGYASSSPIFENCIVAMKNRYPYELVSSSLKQDENIISCKYDPITYPCINPIYQMRIYFQTGKLSEIEILKRFTCYPANHLKLKHLGSIQIGKQADILLLEGYDMQYILQQISHPSIRSVIKRGTQQFPRILI